MGFLKRFFKMLVIVSIVIALVVVGLVAWAFYRDRYYYKFVKTGGHLEDTFTAMGPFEVSTNTSSRSADGAKKQSIWYPTELPLSNKIYPLVVFANGTGSRASTIEPVIRHLSSWGFVVVGNDDENPRSGESTLQTLRALFAMNKDKASILYGKIDRKNVGVAGHSQGGVGAINAAVDGDGLKFKAVFVASPTGKYWGQADVFGC